MSLPDLLSDSPRTQPRGRAVTKEPPLSSHYSQAQTHVPVSPTMYRDKQAEDAALEVCDTPPPLSQ